MDSDTAPVIAYLFLYYYENKWLLDTKNKRSTKNTSFDNLFRVTDDLCAINDHMEFEKKIQNIYPPELS